MSYIVKGYVGTVEEIILKTDNESDAMIEWLSFEEDLAENPSELEPEDRFEYVELLKDGVVINSQHRIDECERCGYCDVLYCHSNGCPSEDELNNEE